MHDALRKHESKGDTAIRRCSFLLSGKENLAVRVKAGTLFENI
jgi:hypothetical protein